MALVLRIALKSRSQNFLMLSPYDDRSDRPPIDASIYAMGRGPPEFAENPEKRLFQHNTSGKPTLAIEASQHRIGSVLISTPES